MNAAFDPDHSGYDALPNSGLQSSDFSQAHLDRAALIDSLVTFDPSQQNSFEFDPPHSSNLDVNLTSFDQYSNPTFLEPTVTSGLESQHECLFPAASASFDLHSNPLYLQDSFYHTGTQDHTLSPPHNELLFGISMDAGQTDGGDNVVWSTAETAGGAYYNERTGEEVEPV